MFDFSIIADEWPTYLEGLMNTSWLVLVSLIAGLCIAIPMGVLRNDQNALLRYPAWAYIYFFRGTPLLVQLFIIYYGAGQWQWLQTTGAWKWFQEAWFEPRSREEGSGSPACKSPCCTASLKI